MADDVPFLYTKEVTSVLEFLHAQLVAVAVALADLVAVNLPVAVQIDEREVGGCLIEVRNDYLKVISGDLATDDEWVGVVAVVTAIGEGWGSGKQANGETGKN